MPLTPAPESETAAAGAVPASAQVLKDFLKVLLVPLLVNKVFMLYFGINYAARPDEGYGYGLAATVAFLFLTVGRFLWKYRGIEDP